MRELKFTLKDILFLLDPNGECEDMIIISEHSEKETWVTAPANSCLIWTEENLKRKVDGIGVCGDMLQIWLADLPKKE